MNDNAKQWVSVLRSSRFKQGTGALHVTRRTEDGDELCCLGVACVLAREAGVPVAVMLMEDEATVAYDGSFGTLPPRVFSWLGLATVDGEFSAGTPIPDSLASRNDSGSTFAEIADIIESEPKGLFA